MPNWNTNSSDVQPPPTLTIHHHRRIVNLSFIVWYVSTVLLFDLTDSQGFSWQLRRSHDFHCHVPDSPGLLKQSQVNYIYFNYMPTLQITEGGQAHCCVKIVSLFRIQHDSCFAPFSCCVCATSMLYLSFWTPKSNYLKINKYFNCYIFCVLTSNCRTRFF